MKRELVTYFLLFALPIYFGCSSLSPVQKESWNHITDEEYQTDELQILTTNGYRYNLNWESLTIGNDTLYASGHRKSAYGDVPFEGSIALKDISQLQTDQFDLELTLILIGILGLIGFFLLMIGADSMKSVGTGIKLSLIGSSIKFYFC